MTFTNRDCILCVSLSERELVFIMNNCLTSPAVQKFFSPHAPNTQNATHGDTRPRGTGRHIHLTTPQFSLICLAKIMSTTGLPIATCLSLVINTLKATPETYAAIIASNPLIYLSTYHPYARMRAPNPIFAAPTLPHFNSQTMIAYSTTLPTNNPYVTVTVDLQTAQNYIDSYISQRNP